jgi:sialic acid synthase SpsE
VDFLDEIKVQAFKIPSADIINLPLLEHTAKKGKPIILSTGMSNMEEIEEAIKTITKYNKEIILMQCTSTYPCKFEDLNLNVIKTYKDKFGFPVGYSGHELGISIPIIAAMLGACMIERHITLDRAMKGGDHAAALEPDGLSKVIRDVKRIPLVLGSLEKKMLDAEIPVRKKLAKSLVSKVKITKGTKITKDMLAIKGPGTGLPPKYYYISEGAIALKDIEEDVVIKEGDIKLNDACKEYI